MAIIDDFKARFPEFDPLIVDQYFPILDPVWRCYYGGTYTTPCNKEIILLLIAHLLTLDISPGAGTTTSTRGVSSQSVGNVSISYGTSAYSSTDRAYWLGMTRYGVLYMTLTRKRSAGFFV